LAIALAVLAGLSICLADSKQDEAAKQVQQTVGKEVAQVKAANDKPRAVKLAQAILASSSDAAPGQAVQAELARAALELALWAGTPEAFALADNAAAALADYGKLPLIERHNLLIRVRTAQLAAAKADQRSQASAALADALAGLAQACEETDDTDAASANYARAAAIAHAANLTDLADQYTQENLRLQRQRLFKNDLAAAQDELRAAIAGNNQPLAQQDNEKIGLLYLTRMADIAQAAPFLAKSGGDWAAAASLLAKLSAGEKLDTDQAILAAEALKRAADRSETGAKSTLMEQVLQICNSAAAQASAAQAAKLEALRQAAKAVLDKTPSDKVAALRKALGNPAGQIKVNPDGSVTLSYTFATQRQLKDWTMTQGQWSIDNPGLTWQGDRCDIFNNIRFRADKPLTLLVEGTTTQPGGIGAMLAADKTDRFNAAHLLLNPRQKDGWQIGALGGKPIVNVNPLPAGPYKLKITFDGSGAFAFILNGQPLGTADLPKGASLADGLRMGLAGTQKNLGSFRFASIQGQPVAAASQPATQPAPVKAPPAPAVQPAPAPNPIPPPPNPRPPGPRRRPPITG
jgi:hypothetical protein